VYFLFHLEISLDIAFFLALLPWEKGEIIFIFTIAVPAADRDTDFYFVS